MKTRFKFLRTGYKSENGDHKWKVGKWYEYDGELELCKFGFHCSKGIYQAFSYVQGEILAEVEVAGKHKSDDNKEVWQKMRIVRSWRWTKKDSVLFAIFAAKQVIKYWEKEYPDDKRPQEAIEAAERFVKNPTKKNREAARAAAGAAAGAAAWAAAGAAAWAAVGAARAARVAGAAWAAVGVAGAAGAILCKKLDKWMLDHLPDLKLLQDKRGISEHRCSRCGLRHERESPHPLGVG